MLVKDGQKIDSALGLKDPGLKKSYFAINLNLREPYQIEKKFK
jgi:hypothetical protein